MPQYSRVNSLELVEGQAEEEDNEEMVSVPEHLKVGATDELQRGGHHQEESHGDDVTSDTSSCHKADGDRVLWGEERERKQNIYTRGAKLVHLYA